jgi:hypothetical protein
MVDKKDKDQGETKARSESKAPSQVSKLKDELSALKERVKQFEERALKAERRLRKHEEEKTVTNPASLSFTNPTDEQPNPVGNIVHDEDVK